MKPFIFNLFLALLLYLPISGSAQCLSGNCQNGTGKMKYESGNTFEGTFRNGQRQQGVFTYTNGDRYEGSYLNNLRHGRGAYFYKSSNRFTGEYVNGEKTYGTLVYTNGNTYVGDFKNDKKHGKGIMYFADGKVLNGYWDQDVFQPQTSRPAHGQTYAVIVGVQDYKNDVPGQFDDLRFTKDDAADYADFLRSPKGGLTPDGNIRLLYDSEASRDNILKVMREVFARAKENDQVIFYFSGHGGEGAFAPYDFDPYTGGQLLYHRDVKAVFKSCLAKNKLCIADACHSGSIREKGGPAPKDMDLAKPAQATIQTYYKALETQEEEYIAVLMSSRSDESSIESGAMAQSIFTYYLVKGLEGAANGNGDQVITITELFTYLQKQVKASTQGEQNPVLFGKFPLDMPVVYL